MNTIRIGIIGSGGMAGTRADHFRQAGHCTISAVAARNPETGKALAEQCGTRMFSNWREVTRHKAIDAVFVATHNALHGEIVLDALDHGKAVLAEYPACSRATEVVEIEKRIGRKDAPVLAFTHRQTVSKSHTALRKTVEGLGQPLASQFSRITPYRGKRPEVLFNLEQSGPPALFFVYHVYPVLDLFAPWERVSSTAVYKGMRENGGYDSFTNALSVAFSNGAIGEWFWAGGVPVPAPAEMHRLIFSEGSLLRTDAGWECHSSKRGALALPEDSGIEEALTQRFLDWAREPDDAPWRDEARRAVDAAAIGIAAERSQREHRFISRSEIFGDTE